MGIFSPTPYPHRRQDPTLTTDADSVFEKIARSKDPANRMYSSKKGLMLWGLFNAVFAILFTIVKLRGFIGGFAWTIDFVLPVSCLLHVMSGALLFKLPIRFTITGFVCIVFYAWMLVSGLLVNHDIGRTLLNTMGWQTIFLLNYITLALSLDQTVYCGPEIRTWVKRALLIVMGISGLVGVAQLLGVGFARRFFESMDNTGMFRPSGATDYPSQLGFQGFAGMLLCAAPIIRRDLKWIEWLGFGFFGMVLLIAQYRSMYYAGFLTGFVPIMVFQFKRNKTTGMVILMTIISALIIPIILFPKKFEYGLRPATNDPALMARQQSWRQIEPILSVRPWTGIGADPNLMLSAQIAATDKWSSTSLDNFYFMVATCFGYTGAILTAIILLLLLGGISMRLAQSEGEAKEWSFMSLMCLICILLFSLTGNTLVYQPVGFFFTCCLGLSSLTWREELSVSKVTGILVSIRRIFSPSHKAYPRQPQSRSTRPIS